MGALDPLTVMAESAVAFSDTNSVGVAGTDFKLSRPDLFEF
jgi:hypothetical protein